jgi:hypothetical protein
MAAACGPRLPTAFRRCIGTGGVPGQCRAAPAVGEFRGSGCVVMGPFAGVRTLAGRLLFRDPPRGGAHHRRGRYARTGLTAAARSGRSVSPRSRRADQHRRGPLLLVPERLQRWHRRALPRSRRQNSPASLPALPLGTRRHMTSARSPRRPRAWAEGGAADRQPVVSGRPGTQALGMTTWCGWTRCSEVR